MSTRKVAKLWKSRPTLEGAGVRLRRAFGNDEVPLFDPFLLLDDFRASEPKQYIKGFPWHPHRGIETITYMLDGRVEHGDSLGNKGVISPGDVQWMTAGSGIVHQEMPTGDKQGVMGGFQLWANLPAGSKMMRPRYREVKAAAIPEADAGGGVRVRVICGQAAGVTGPVRDIVTEPQYLDVTVPAGGMFEHRVKQGHTAFAYIIGGRGRCGADREPHGDGTLLLFGDGDRVALAADGMTFRLLLISGRPLGEPVAWGGPIVMNTEEELELAFAEYRDGTFVKNR
jgi:quercetin 2,3-dioxygenase